MAGELIEEFGEQLESIVLAVTTGGRFEVEANGHTVFSKQQTHRHPAPGEVIENVRKLVGAQVGGQDVSVWQG